MATNFLYYAGTSGNTGLLVATPVTLVSTEMVSLGTSAVAIGATTFTSSYTGQGILADLFLTFSTSISAPTPGANFAVWFLTSPDGGTTFESSVTFNPVPNRSPDALIPISTIAINSSSVFRSQGIVRVPALEFKVAIQNNLGTTFSSTTVANPTLKLAPYAIQY